MEYFDDNAIVQEVLDTAETLVEWAGQFFAYESKNERIREWNPEFSDFYTLACHIYACVALHPQGITYQALIGYISGTIRCANPLDRAKCAAEVIAVAYMCELILITKTSDKTMMITTEHQLPVEIPEFPEHIPSAYRPAPLDRNSILGCRFKQHSEDTSSDHLDRMNGIAFSLETRVIDSLGEHPSTVPETPEQWLAWDQFHDESMRTYQLIRNQMNNRFYLEHSFDTRGRCYCSGYYVTYQGSSFKKAIIQLADKEIVRK
jgi:hypothetical protein